MKREINGCYEFLTFNLIIISLNNKFQNDGLLTLNRFIESIQNSKYWLPFSML
jgi:hypothetical protein